MVNQRRRVRIYPYNQHSQSAKAIRNGIDGCKVLRREGSRFRPRPSDFIINWGSSDFPFEGGGLNHPNCVEKASNKLSFFIRMGTQEWMPKYWSKKEDIPLEEFPIVCRTILNGHSGAGIVIANNPEELVDASLYVKYEKKKDEYRIHVGDKGESIIGVQRKARRHDYDDPNWQVRNHANGFIYAREGFEVPPPVLEAAKASLVLSGLDFGAVDVIWNSNRQRAFVLEINCAPGLTGTTVDDYVTYFKGKLNQ